MKKAKPTAKIRLRKEYLKEIETGELDFILYDMIFGKEWENMKRERNIVVGRDKYNSTWGGESIPIPISMVRKILDQLEKKGSDFVEIMHHTDHISYVFNGMKITKATEKECQKENEKEKKKKEIELEVNKLEAAKRILINQYEKIK